MTERTNRRERIEKQTTSEKKILKETGVTHTKTHTKQKKTKIKTAMKNQKNL